MQVPDDLRDELVFVLDNDTSQLGDAHRTVLMGGTVSAYHLVLLAAVLDGKVPTAATHRAQAAQQIRRLMLDQDMSIAAGEQLTRMIQAMEGAPVEAPKPAAPTFDTPCIYVYTLPSYWTKPVSPDGRTWMKVGRTSGDPRARVMAQGKRTTGLPEDPILLRVYETTNGTTIELIEQLFHSVLIAFGHQRQTGNATGREWFLTSVTALDALATIAGMTRTYHMTQTT